MQTAPSATARPGLRVPAVVLAGVLAALLVLVGHAHGVQAQQADADGVVVASFADLRPGDLALAGPNGAVGFVVPLPVGRGPGPATVAVSFTHLPDIPEATTLTILAAGTVVEQAELGPRTAPGAVLTADVPETLVGSDRLDVQVRVAMPAADPAGCGITAGPVVVDTAASSVRVATAAAPVRLSDVPRVLVGAAVAVDVGGVPADVAAAAAVAWQHGRWHATSAIDPVLVAGPDEASTVLTVGPGGGEGAERSGLSLTVAEGLPTLSLVGESDVLAAAAGVLASPALRRIATDVVDGGTLAALAAGEATPPPWADGSTSLRALDLTLPDVVGTGQTLLVLPLALPWTPGGDLVLDLAVERPPAVSAASPVSLLVDGVTVDVAPLGEDGVVRLVAPADALGSRQVDLALGFDVAVTDEACGTDAAAAATVRVLGGTTVTVPPGDRDVLAGFPSRLGEAGRSVTVLADLADPQVRLAALQVVAAFGRWGTDRAVVPTVVQVPDADQSLPDGDLVAVGALAVERTGAAEVGVPIVGVEPGTPAAALALVDRADTDGVALLLDGDGPGVLAGARVLTSAAHLALLDVPVTGVLGDPTRDGEVVLSPLSGPPSEDPATGEGSRTALVVALLLVTLLAGVLVARRPSGR